MGGYSFLDRWMVLACLLAWWWVQCCWCVSRLVGVWNVRCVSHEGRAHVTDVCCVHVFVGALLTRALGGRSHVSQLQVGALLS